MQGQLFCVVKIKQPFCLNKYEDLFLQMCSFLSRFRLPGDRLAERNRWQRFIPG